MAYTGFGGASLTETEAETIFNKSFGRAGVHHEMEYYNPWTKKDFRSRIGKRMLEKTDPSINAGITGGIGTGGAGTAGSALIPVWVDTFFTDQTKYLTPMVELIPRFAVKGKTYDYNKITAKGGAKWKLENAALENDVDTYDRGSVSMKFGYSTGSVTGPAIAAMRGYVDPKELDLGVKAQALKELEEDTIINGDATTYPTEYDGLINSITTNTTAVGGAITLALIRAELATTFNAKGMVTLAVTDATTHNVVKGLLLAYQRQLDHTAQNIPFGIPNVFAFDGVDFLKSQFMPTGANVKRCLFLDMRYIRMGVLQDATYQEIPTQNDSWKYTIKLYAALVVTYEGACSQLYTID